MNLTLDLIGIVIKMKNTKRFIKNTQEYKKVKLVMKTTTRF